MSSNGLIGDITGQAFAQTKEIIAEGTYNMGDGETPSVAENRALIQAKRIAAEQAGTYVKSYTQVKNFQLTEDEIEVLASGIMEVTILDKKRTMVGDGLLFWIKIKAIVKVDKIEEMTTRVKDKSVVEDYKKIQESYEKVAKEIAELKRQLLERKDEGEKKHIEAKITNEEKLLQANQWFEKGYQHTLKNEHDSAIDAYTNAIALDPNDTAAYNNRGNAYNNKGQYDKAIEDYNKAIALDPNDADAYNNRGSAYDDKGQYDRAIEDYNKAIVLDSNHYKAYYNCGLVYARRKRQYGRAIENLSKAIAINPDIANYYFIRGSVYVLSGNGDKAYSDYEKACDMGFEKGCKSLKDFQ